MLDTSCTSGWCNGDYPWQCLKWDSEPSFASFATRLECLEQSTAARGIIAACNIWLLPLLVKYQRHRTLLLGTIPRTLLLLYSFLWFYSHVIGHYRHWRPPQRLHGCATRLETRIITVKDCLNRKLARRVLGSLSTGSPTMCMSGFSKLIGRNPVSS